MIETKIFTKAKKGNGGASSSSIGTRYISGTISEAEHAARADKARKADSATQADYATNSGNAKVSDYARKAAEVDGDAEVLQNYLRKDYMEEADGSDHVEEVDNNVLFDRDVEFLNGFTADEASTFLGAAEFRGKNTFYGLANFLKTIYATTIENSGTIKTKNLEVTGSAHFFELIIDKVKSAGGAALFTPADGFEVDLVALVNGNYRLFWRCRDAGGKQRDNMWRKGDQALCMSFNQASVGTSHNVANKYYWALVTGVSDNSSPYLLKDEYYNYIDISRTDSDGTVNPEVGDSIVMLGYRGTDDKDRQSAIYISAYTSLDSGLIAPLFAQYRGINDFNLAKHRTTYHDARGSKVVGQFETEDGQSIEDYVDNAVDGAVDSAASVFEGRLNATATAMQSQYKELSGKYDNLPLKSQDELTEYSSKIEQTARKISMSVGATMVGRRNLLVGSEFKRFDEENMTGQGERDACRLRTGDQYDGYNSCRIISESDSYHYNGVVFKRIRVDGNTKYTLTAMAKRLSDSFGTGCYAIIHEFLTKDAEYDGYQHSCFLLTTDDAKNSWVQKSHTFTTHSETRYINVILCVSTFGSFAVCKPMLERGETFGGYSLSEYDYEYIGGNLIDNSRFLKAGGTLVYVQDSVSQELGSDYAIATATASGSSSSGVFAIKKTLKAGVDYVLSWYIKRTGGDEYGQCTVNFGRKILYSELYTGTQASNSVEGDRTPYSGYHGIRNIPTEWTRMWIHFRLSEDWSDSDNQFYIQLYGGGTGSSSITAMLSRPKLEEGAWPTEWTDNPKTYVEEGSLANKLYATGIDIESGEITITADKTKFRNNAGKVMGMFDKDRLKAALIDAEMVVANGIRTQELEAQNLNVNGNSTFGIWKIGKDSTWGNMIQAKGSFSIGGTTYSSGSGIMYCPMFIRGGSTLAAYMRVGPYCTEFGYLFASSRYQGVWHGQAAKMVCNGAANSWSLPTNYTYNTSYNPVSYVYAEKEGNNDPAMVINVSQKGVTGTYTAIEANGAIKGVIAPNVQTVSSSSQIQGTVSTVVCANSSGITLTLPRRPVAGQMLLVIQRGSGSVTINRNSDDGAYIRKVGDGNDRTSVVSSTIGQMSIFLYDGQYWIGSFLNAKF